MWGQTEVKTDTVGARVIAVDRPGYGESTFHPDRTYIQGAQDIKELADYLQLSKFAVMGYSSGGPNAMACAVSLAERVSACGLVSSDGPYFDIGNEMIQKLYGIPEITIEANNDRIKKEYESLYDSYNGLTKEDRKEIALFDLNVACAQGLDQGPAQDAILETRKWDFNISNLNLEGSPPVLLWHGTDDTAVPVEVAKYIVSAAPCIQASYVEGESHSMIRRRWDQFLTELIQLATKSV